MSDISTAPGSRRPREVDVRTIGWLAGVVVFLLLRALAALHLPVFGAELVHLSGAWQAAAGVEDARFVPTAFQAVTALLLQADASERLPRLLAFLLTGTVPAALWRLRAHFGRDGALAALWLLAIDPVSIVPGATASAMALDTAVAVWLLLLLVRGGRPRLARFAAGLAAAVTGPSVFLLVLGWFAVSPGAHSWRSAAIVIGGFAAGVLLASFGFGLGPATLVVPPFDLLAAGSDQDWSTASTLDLLLLYGLPLTVAGAAACFSLLRSPFPAPRLVLAWAAASAAWLALSLPDHNPAALAGLTLPFALATGMATPRAVAVAVRARWREAWPALAGAALALILAWAIVAGWARVERAGDGFEQLRLATFLGVAAVLVVAVALRRETRGALAVPVGLAGLAMLVTGASAVAAGGGSEPLASPSVAPAARDLRDLAVARRAAGRGEIVVHPALEDAITWPFRDSGTLVVASTIPANAGTVLWPATAPAPEGLTPLVGSQALTWAIRSPTADILDSLHWFLDRNTLAAKRVPISVYTREQP